MSDLYDALEECLQALEQGQALDLTLARYGELATELRPLLEISLQARSLSAFPIPSDIQRRGRARLLQHASRLRQSTRRPRSLLSLLPRLALVLAIVAILLSSIGLVNASAGALPGDRLYSVKRTWESLRLRLAFHPAEREFLKSRFEQERLDEIGELLARGRTARIEFSGLITELHGERWQISGIPLLITPTTRLPVEAIAEGALIWVSGMTRPDGVVEAFEIRLLSPAVSSSWRPSEEEHEEETPAPTPIPPTPEEEQERTIYRFTGLVQTMQGNVWNIGGQMVYVDQAEIYGKVVPGALVECEGYYDASGRFVAMKIEVKESVTKNWGKESGPEGENESEDGNGNETEEEEEHEQEEEE